MSAPRTTRHRACIRYVLVRITQFERHACTTCAEFAGTAPCPRHGDITHVTELGQHWCWRIRFGGGIAKTLGLDPRDGNCMAPLNDVYSDGSREAEATLRALSLGNHFQVWNEAGMIIDVPDAGSIIPVLIVGSADFINAKLQAALGNKVRYALPLLSCSVYDEFGDGSPPFVHVIGDRSLCPDAKWWANGV